MRVHAESLWTPRMQQVYGGLQPRDLADYTPLQIEGLLNDMDVLAQSANPFGGGATLANGDPSVRVNDAPSRRQRPVKHDG